MNKMLGCQGVLSLPVEFDPNWDLSGAVDDLRLLFKVGYRLAMESTFPNWKEGTPYKAKRDADIEAASKRPAG